MNSRETLQLVVRTPHEKVLELRVRSIRVLTETGHVGLRPRMEPSVLPLEAGVVHARAESDGKRSEHYIGTAGGLLMCNRGVVTLLTPIAVVGDNQAELTGELESLMTQPNSELEARTAFNKLEGHILTEIRREQTVGVGGMHASDV